MESLLESYVQQATDDTCSAATVAMIANSLSRADPGTSIRWTEADVLQSVSNDGWEALAHSDAGVVLPRFESLAIRALAVLAPDFPLVATTHHVREAPESSSPEAALLRRELRAMESTRAKPRWIVFNFSQSALTGYTDTHGPVGHYSLAAAYDETQDRVLILDTDLENFGPYWAPLSDTIQALSLVDPDSGLSRGYVVIEPAR